MKLSGNTILITGGSEGVGFELARQLHKRNTVIICGRSESKLEQARQAIPSLRTEQCDVTDEGQRTALVQKLKSQHSELNLLINNAGGRQLAKPMEVDRTETAMNLDLMLNFIAPVSLGNALLPLLRSQPQAGIVNVTTGLVYMPKVDYTYYCAAKAALHSYTRSLRWSLAGSSVSVFEALLPLVDTGFHREGLPRSLKAMSADNAARGIIKNIEKSKPQFGIGKAALAKWVSAIAPFKGMMIVNGRSA